MMTKETLNEVANMLLDCARVLAQERGMDPLDAMGALGFAATKLIYLSFDNDEARLKAVSILCQ